MGWRDTIQKDTPSEDTPKSSWRDTIQKEPSLVEQAGDAWTSFSEGIPGMGLAKKLGRAGNAGLQKLEENVRQTLGEDIPDKPYGDIYDEIQKQDLEEERQRFSRSPKTSTAASMAGAFMAPNPASIAGRVGLNVADAATRGESYDEATEGAKGAGLISAGVESLPFVGKYLKGAGKAVKGYAEDAAVRATGATGAQRGKFRDNSGRELLNQDVVKFGASPKGVAKEAKKQLDASYDEIDSSLKALDAKGAAVTKDDLIEYLQKERDALKGRASQNQVKKQLDGYIEDISAGPDKLPLSAAEVEKRAFQKQANYDKDLIGHDAKKSVARAYMGAVEKRATEMAPELADTFKTGKKRYQVFEPIEKAAAKRADTLSQSPIGGLLDTTSILAGTAASGASGDPMGILGGVAAAAARRNLSPRIASSVARSADSLGNVLNRMGDLPQKYQKMLVGSPQEIALTHYILQKEDKEYRKLIGEK